MFHACARNYIVEEATNIYPPKLNRKFNGPYLLHCTQVKLNILYQHFVMKHGSKSGVGNFFGFAGHIRDELAIRGQRGPVLVHVN